MEPKRTVTYMVLKAAVNNRRNLVPYQDEFCGPRSDHRSGAIKNNNKRARNGGESKVSEDPESQEVLRHPCLYDPLVGTFINLGLRSNTKVIGDEPHNFE
ncbi:hypothetical protein TNCV_694951 [Trichonephila clavipes]|nr:hypothetical protein TNCV_694951 [Trichonephila clavipes]